MALAPAMGFPNPRIPKGPIMGFPKNGIRVIRIVSISVSALVLPEELLAGAIEIANACAILDTKQ